MIEYFNTNTAGRDFVVGDIHGCFDQLEDALKSYGFDPQRDRCFAVGDLVDRGPNSLAVLDYLAQPWFHACLGNHEDMVLHCSLEITRERYWFEANGGEWWMALDAPRRKQIHAAFEKLPLAMEVTTAHGKVGIVHADVPPRLSWPDFLKLLQRGDIDCRQEALWGRRRAKGKVRHGVSGIDRVVSGHSVTPDLKIHVIENYWLIDTGAFLNEINSQLTVLPLDELFR